MIIEINLAIFKLDQSQSSLHNNEHHQNITMESDFQRHMKDGNNCDDIEMPVGMRGSG